MGGKQFDYQGGQLSGCQKHLYQFGRFAVEIRQRYIQKEGEKPEVIIQNVKRKILLEIRKIFNGPKDIS